MFVPSFSHHPVFPVILSLQNADSFDRLQFSGGGAESHQRPPLWRWIQEDWCCPPVFGWPGVQPCHQSRPCPKGTMLHPVKCVLPTSYLPFSVLLWEFCIHGASTAPSASYMHVEHWRVWVILLNVWQSLESQQQGNNCFEFTTHTAKTTVSSWPPTCIHCMFWPCVKWNDLSGVCICTPQEFVQKTNKTNWSTIFTPLRIWNRVCVVLLLLRKAEKVQVRAKIHTLPKVKLMVRDWTALSQGPHQPHLSPNPMDLIKYPNVLSSQQLQVPPS